jgi:DUF917 family protein
VRTLDLADLDDVALGAAVLGAGGGGDPYIGKLLAREFMRRHGLVELVDAAEVLPDGFVVAVGMIGAPTIVSEKVPRGDEFAAAVSRLEGHLRRRVTHIVAEEVGGGNSLIPICAAAALQLPLVDADLMGRAFPEIQMCLPTLAGISCTPMTLTDEKGNSCVIDSVDNGWAERLARAVTIEMGCSAVMALYPMSGDDVRENAILGTLTRAQQLGAALRDARASHQDPSVRIAEELGGRVLLRGKVGDVARRVDRGFTCAEVDIEGLDGDAGRLLHLSTQNEHLVVWIDGSVVATVPDLIIMLESDSGDPVLTERVRYGLRVTVVAAPCDERWRSPAGIAITGPGYFGYDTEYVSLDA